MFKKYLERERNSPFRATTTASFRGGGKGSRHTTLFQFHRTTFLIQIQMKHPLSLSLSISLSLFVFAAPSHKISRISLKRNAPEASKTLNVSNSVRCVCEDDVAAAVSGE